MGKKRKPSKKVQKQNREIKFTAIIGLGYAVFLTIIYAILTSNYPETITLFWIFPFQIPFFFLTLSGIVFPILLILILRRHN